MKIFISHSSRDSVIAGLLIDLLRLSLNLQSEDIRCTSVEGYRLPGGASTDEMLRREVHEAVLFIGLITPHSIHSPYVLFELGARWGAEKTLIPLLASGADAEHLRGPLSGINAMNCSVPAQVHQLVEEAAKHLSVDPSRPSTYQKAHVALVTASSEPVAYSRDAVIAVPESEVRSDLSKDEGRILTILASDHVGSNKELRIRVISDLLGMNIVKVKVLVEKLKGAKLVGQRISGSDSFGLTPDGERYIVEIGLV